jgi:phosphocarrier protein HPr
MNDDCGGGAAALARTVTICNQRGLHARAAGRFVKVAGRFSAEIMVSKDGQSVSGRSIMGLMMLAAGPGSAIEITSAGDDAPAAMEALIDLVECGFEEDD